MLAGGLLAADFGGQLVGAERAHFLAEGIEGRILRDGADEHGPPLIDLGKVGQLAPSDN